MGLTTTGVAADAKRTARARSLLEKALGAGLTSSESVYLADELSRLASRIARVNALAGKQAVELSPYARLVSDAGASAPVAV